MFSRDRNRSRHRGVVPDISTVVNKISSVLAENIIDLDMRLLESYSGTGTDIVNIEGNTLYDVDFTGLTFEGTAGTGNAKTTLGTGGIWAFNSAASALTFLNGLHKDDVSDYYMGFLVETGTSLASNKFMDLANGEGLELIMASDGRTKSKRRTTSGNEEITTSGSGLIPTSSTLELFMTRQASDGAFKVYINESSSPETATVAYTLSETADADSSAPGLLYDFSDSGWKGIAVCGGNKYLSDADVATIRAKWAERE